MIGPKVETYCSKDYYIPSGIQDERPMTHFQLGTSRPISNPHYALTLVNGGVLGEHLQAGQVLQLLPLPANASPPAKGKGCKNINL